MAENTGSSATLGAPTGAKMVTLEFWLRTPATVSAWPNTWPSPSLCEDLTFHNDHDLAIFCYDIYSSLLLIAPGIRLRARAQAKSGVSAVIVGESYFVSMQ